MIPSAEGLIIYAHFQQLLGYIFTPYWQNLGISLINYECIAEEYKVLMTYLCW